MLPLAAVHTGPSRAPGIASTPSRPRWGCPLRDASPRAARRQLGPAAPEVVVRALRRARPTPGPLALTPGGRPAGSWGPVRNLASGPGAGQSSRPALGTTKPVRRQEIDLDRMPQSGNDAPEHRQRGTFVSRLFQTADRRHGRANSVRQLPLRKAGPGAQVVHLLGHVEIDADVGESTPLVPREQVTLPAAHAVRETNLDRLAIARVPGLAASGSRPGAPPWRGRPA
jgi:hypothetical protein